MHTSGSLHRRVLMWAGSGWSYTAIHSRLGVFHGLPEPAGPTIRPVATRRGYLSVLVAGLLVAACSSAGQPAPFPPGLSGGESAAARGSTDRSSVASAVSPDAAAVESGSGTQSLASVPSDSAGGRAGAAATTTEAGRVDGPRCPLARCISVVVTGDVLLHPPLWEQAAADAATENAGAVGPASRLDFGPLLAAQRPYLQAADIAVCHLETPVAAPGADFEGYPAFAVPPSIVPALAGVGYDACSTASNHTADQGAEGVVDTLNALDAAGIAHAGSYRTEAESRQPTLLSTPGGVVALIAAAYGLNTGRPDQPWRVDVIDVPTILGKAAAARSAGADIVVVALHAGTEYDNDPTATQQQVARQLLDSADVDFVYGHHAHVVQPVERIGDKWVAYGLGNTVAAHGISDLGNREGLLVRVTFGETAGRWTTTDVAWVPSLVDDRRPYRWCALSVDSSCSDADTVSLDRIAAVVNRRGADRDGAHEWSSP